MNIRFVTVNDANINLISKLHISEAQKGMVETVDECYSEAKEFSSWRPIAIEKDEELIGFAMYGLCKSESKGDGAVWLDRFFIDENYQGRGYSKTVLSILIEHIVAEYNCKKIYLSVYENNSVAIDIYEKKGFTFNGEIDINGEKVMTLDIK